MVARIRLVPDNQSAHVSQETRAYLATTANRFEFLFTPVHDSWLTLLESFSAKLTKPLLCDMRVESKDELKQRMEQFIDRLNEGSAVFKASYRMDNISAA